MGNCVKVKRIPSSEIIQKQGIRHQQLHLFSVLLCSISTHDVFQVIFLQANSVSIRKKCHLRSEDILKKKYTK